VRYFVEFQGQYVELLPGETMLGRDLTCRIRFNDAVVSRRHLRFVTSDGGVVVEDLGSANGTRLNGARLDGSSPLTAGDELWLGQRCLRIRAVDGDQGLPPLSPMAEAAARMAAELPSLGAGPDEVTPRMRADSAGRATLRQPALGVHNCPRCRKLVSSDVDRCPQCGNPFPPGRPGSVTVRLPPSSHGERRSEPRVPVDLMAVYSSDTISFEARALDVSMGGAFITSELLEPVGTTCQVALLPDGFPAFYFNAQVAHVIDGVRTGTPHPTGLGVRFLQMSPDSARWLSDHVRRFRVAS
jgi:hypothetical protein